MSFKRSFFKNISSFAAYNYISQAFEFLSTIILSRLLLPDEYGFVAIINIFSGFILLFANVGIGQSVIRTNYGHTYYKHLYSLSVWMGFGLMITMILLAYPISVFFDNKALILPAMLVSLKFVVDSFTYIPYAILSKKLEFNFIGKAKLWGAIVQISLTIILAFLGFSYWSLIIPIIIGPIFQFAYLKRRVNLPFRLYGWKATKRTLYRIRTLMGALSLNNLLSYWTSNADKVVVGRLYTQADLGLYNRAFRFIQISNTLITSIFNTVLFPTLKKLIVEKGNVAKEYFDILRIITFFNMPVVIILVLFPEQLVHIIWGVNWLGVAQYLPYVAMILVFNSIISSSSSVFILYEKEKNMFFINTAISIVTIIVVIIGGHISMMAIMRSLVLSNIMIFVPVIIYFGFFKSFKYKIFVILKFWLPVIIYVSMLFLGTYFNNMTLKISAICIYLVFILYELWPSVIGVLSFIKNKVLRR